jgi:hypothetical protein
MSKRPRIQRKRSSQTTDGAAKGRAERRTPPAKQRTHATASVPSTLRALREHVGKTQNEISRAMPMSQSQLSRLEGRHDHLVSTLRRYVEALGGEIEVVALVDGTRFALRDV